MKLSKYCRSVFLFCHHFHCYIYKISRYKNRTCTNAKIRFFLWAFWELAIAERCPQWWDCTAHVSAWVRALPSANFCPLFMPQGQSRTKAGKMLSWQSAEYGIRWSSRGQRSCVEKGGDSGLLHNNVGRTRIAAQVWPGDAHDCNSQRDPRAAIHFQRFTASTERLWHGA